MAKKQVLQIKDFSGGVNSYSDPRDLQENEFQILDNASVDEQGIIRVSGGLELKDNIDLDSDANEVDTILSIAGKGLFSHKTDYLYGLQEFNYDFNSNLEKDGADSANAWGVVKNDGDGTWAFEQTSSNTNETSASGAGASNSFAINYDEYSAASSRSVGEYNHGSLTFNNVPLKEDTNYSLRIRIVSEKPWCYLGSNIPPRIRLYSPTDSLYYHPSSGFTSVSDATHTAICNDNIGNFIDTPSSYITGDAGNADHVTWSSATHGDGDWTANGNAAILDRELIDANTPIASSANHKEFNSLFGEIATSGNMTNGWALELEGTATGYFNAGNAATCSPLTVVASTQYLFDAFYFTSNEHCMVRIKKAGTATYLFESGILDPQSKWTHVSGNTEYPEPIMFETPSGCTSIEIEITVYADGDVAFFAGFNIRKNVMELSKLSEGGTGEILSYFKYPNSWANESGGSILDSSYIYNDGLNALFKNMRAYEFPFYIGNHFTDNKFTIVIDNGVWGVANESGTTVNNIMIDSIEILESEGTASFEVGPSEIYSTARGNLIFHNSCKEQADGGKTTKVLLHQYNPGNQTYEDISDTVSLPSVSGRTNFNFFKSGSNILFCDESFGSKSLYKYGYNKKNSSSELSIFNSEGVNISYFSNSTSNGLHESVYDALDGWLGIHGSNRRELAMISQEMDDFMGLDYQLATYEPWPFGRYLGNKFNQHSHGGTSNINGTINPIDHDNASDRFQYNPGAGFHDNTHPYTKYITIPCYDIAQVLTASSRIGKITIDFRHWMLWGWNVPAGGAIGEDYTPKMDIYIDAVSSSVVAHDGTDYSGTFEANSTADAPSNFIATIAHKEVNPYNLRMGYHSETGPIPGSLGYDVSVNHDFRSSYIPGGLSGQGQSGRMFKSNIFDTDGKRPLRVEFEFPYDHTFTTSAGTATNLTVNASTGVNLQIRIVPQIHYDLDFASQGNYGNHGTPNGIMAECWRVEDIKIQSWKTTQSENLSTQFSNINIDDFGFNMAFETPSEGEADGWDDDWTPTFTSVDYNDIESAFGNYNFEPIKNTDVTKCPGVGFTYDLANTKINNKKLIKCYMTSSRNAKYNLQFTIDTDKRTIQSSSSARELDAVVENNIIHYSLQSKYLLIPNEIDSYDSETGVLEENAHSPEKLKAVFKTAVIANNTLYAGNIYQDGETYPDRMLKSPIGKSPLLPSTNFIDVAINDGDEITCLEFYKDRLLQFKKEKLFIISTSEDYEYLQDTVDNVGVASSSQVTMTPYGVAWINERGCYLYDGQKVNNLTDGKLAYKKWKDSESSWEIDEKYGPVIHYLKKDDKIIVYGATDSILNIGNSENEGWHIGPGDYHINKEYLRQLGYQYDFQTKSWVNLTNFLEGDVYSFTSYNSDDRMGKTRVPFAGNMITNFSYDENSDSICIIKPDNRILKWDDNPKKTMGHLELTGLSDNIDPNTIHRDFRVITKDYDFEAPSVNKKVYKVYVTFKSTEFESYKLKKVMQRQDLYSSSNVGVYYAINGTNTWTEFSETKSKNYGTKGLVNDDAETTTTISSSVSSTDTTISVTSASNIKVGYVLKIYSPSTSVSEIDANPRANEQMLVKSISGTTITVDRNYGYHQGDGVTFSHDSNSVVIISTGDWIVAELKPSSSINKIDSLKLKFETKKRTVGNESNGVPPGFMINDISVIYRTKNVR